MADAHLLERARNGDGEAFRELTGPYRRELLAHCYRMLASAQDAEDTVQDTMLAAWQGLGSFQERASLRTWLYRIATNRCLNALRSASRRPAMSALPVHGGPAGPPRVTEVTWLEPSARGIRPRPSVSATLAASSGSASTFTALSARAVETTCCHHGSISPPGLTGTMGSVMPPHRVQAS